MPILPRPARGLSTPLAVAPQYDISPRDEVYYCLATGGAAAFSVFGGVRELTLGLVRTDGLRVRSLRTASPNPTD